jgi:hypothetical protein
LSQVLEVIHRFKFPSELGHENVEWIEGDIQSEAKAKKLFEDKIAAGWQAFKPSEKKEGDWVKLEEFDPKQPQILLLPLTKKLAGGG